jgi:hypothetical protein
MDLRSSLDTAQALLKVNHPAACCGVSKAHDVNDSDSVTPNVFIGGPGPDSPYIRSVAEYHFGDHVYVTPIQQLAGMRTILA